MTLEKFIGDFSWGHVFFMVLAAIPVIWALNWGPSDKEMKKHYEAKNS